MKSKIRTAALSGQSIFIMRLMMMDWLK